MTESSHELSGLCGAGGVVKLTTETGSIILVDLDLRLYRQASACDPSDTYDDGNWLAFRSLGSLAIGRRVQVKPAAHDGVAYESSPLVAKEELVPLRELNADDIETECFVGKRINRNPSEQDNR